ncbi:MAG: hypothetical protein ACWA6Y_03345 [Polaromonas sp.]
MTSSGRGWKIACHHEHPRPPDKPDLTMPPASNPKHERRIAIGLAVLIAVVMVSLGALAIISGVSTGSTKSHGTVTLLGSRARWFGAVQVCLGMLALALAMPTKKVALGWMLAWMGLMFSCLVAGLVQSQS